MSLTKVKVASLYERVTDGKLINRSIDDVIEILKETKTDFIFRGWWIWRPCANSCSEVPPEITYPYGCEEQGYSYEYLEDAISEIKKELPDIIFCGAIPAQRVNFIDINPITGRVYDQQETNAMALDPAKWDITSVSKKQLQDYFQEHATGGMGYFPDITNDEFQSLILSWAKKQIDCGADAIWIDMLFAQAQVLKEITGDPYHSAVEDSWNAAISIADEIRKYGYSKYEEYIYVGSWSGVEKLPYTHNLDFVTVTPSSDEINDRTLNNKKWEIKTTAIRKKLGDIPIFAFIDWADDNAPTAVFSQKLTPAEQRDFLIAADDFFAKKGIKFIYPVHGGFMGAGATILSFGEFGIYDSLAPEFQTYDTIKGLAQKKATPCLEEYAKCLFPRIFTQNPAPRILTKDPIPRISCLMQTQKQNFKCFKNPF